MGSSKSHESWDLYHEMISFTRFRADSRMAGAGALLIYDLHGRFIIMVNGKDVKECLELQKYYKTKGIHTS